MADNKTDSQPPEDATPEESEPKAASDQTAEEQPKPSLKNPRHLLKYILQLDDTPHSIALGVAIGMLIGMTPTVGIQMLMVVVTAAICKPFFTFNRLAALVTVYISNPLTMVPIYYFLYWVGTFFVAGTATQEDFARIVEFEGFAEWWDAIVELFIGIGWPLLIGTAIVAPISAVISYPVTLWLVNRFRRKRSASPVNRAAN